MQQQLAAAGTAACMLLAAVEPQLDWAWLAAVAESAAAASCSSCSEQSLAGSWSCQG